MGIQKTKTLANGLTGNYWKITSIIVDKQSMMAIVRTALFTAASYTATGPIAPGLTYTIPVTKSNLVGDLVAFCYTSVKAQANVVINGQPYDPNLAGGTDVLNN